MQLKWQMGQSDRSAIKNGGWNNVTDGQGDRLKRRQIDKGRIEVLTLNGFFSLPAQPRRSRTGRADPEASILDRAPKLSTARVTLPA